MELVNIEKIQLENLQKIVYSIFAFRSVMSGKEIKKDTDYRIKAKIAVRGSQD